MNKQFARVDVEKAKARYKEGLPVSLKQLSLALEVGYDIVRAWRCLPGFPYEHRLIFPEDFKIWRQRRLGLSGRQTKSPKKAEEAQQPVADTGGDDAFIRSLPAAAREQVARILSQARW